jgi:nucleoid-associated protein YgaU
MRRDKQIALALFATVAAACSSTPAPRILAAVGNSPSAAPAAATTIAAADAATADAAAASPSAVDAGLVKAGYSVMKRHGEIFYCRNEVITGQRIGTRICLTAAQLQVEKQNVTKARDLLNQPAYRCLGASCNN